MRNTVFKQYFYNMQKKKATGTKTAAGSRSMKQNLDTGVEVCDNKAKKKQRHTTNEKPNCILYLQPIIHKFIIYIKISRLSD